MKLFPGITVVPPMKLFPTTVVPPTTAPGITVAPPTKVLPTAYPPIAPTLPSHIHSDLS